MYYGLIFVMSFILAFSVFFGVAHADYSITNSTLPGTTVLNIRNSPTHGQTAVQFTTSDAGTISSLEAAFDVTGSPGTDLVVKIYTDTGGEPDTSLGTSDAIAVPDGCTTYPAVFSTPVDVDASTAYWLVFDNESGSVDGGGNYLNCGDGTGNSLRWNGDSWDMFSDADIAYDISVVSEGGGGGGGGGGESSTSTVDQIHRNLFSGFVLFFISMFFVVFVFKR